MTRVSDGGSYPHFGADNDRIFMTEFDGDTAKLVSVNREGRDDRVHASGDLITEYQVAPSGDYLSFAENYSAFVMPLTAGPQEIGAGMSASAVPVTRVNDEGATYMNWSGDRLNWSLGPTLFGAPIGDLLPAAPVGEDNDGYEPPEDGVDLSINVTAAKAVGVTALTGAKIITMAGADGGVIENGVIVINGDRITAIGEAGSVTVPANARTVDMTGKVITPGFIDAHAHGAQGSDDIIPQQNWSAIAHLALGVTTVHDPSSSASHIFTSSEYQRAGMIIAPRTYSTGEIVYGAKAPGYYAVINDIEDARDHVRRLKAQGAHSIKNYNQPRRDQRQQVVAAAKEENMAVVAEGGSLYHMDLAMVADGNTAIEHNLPQAKLYEDVLSFYSATEVAYTPTLVVTYGGPAGDPYWRQAMDVWRHPILAAHAPPRILEASSVRREKAPEEDYVDQVSAATSKALADRGVLVSIGAHGQQQGLAAHWEMWSFARGGMSPLEALRTATTAPAEHLGFARRYRIA